jgi:uncharacterized protein
MVPISYNYQKLKRLRAQIPSFQCKIGCHDCCGPVTASSEEMARMPVKGEQEHATALADLRCPHLGENGCEAYDERPLICRLFGTSPKLPCPNGNRPDVMINPQIELQILRFMEDTRQVLV